MDSHMQTRRRVAGVLAICAFALSYGEALRAAACTMDMPASMAMEMPMPANPEQGESDTPLPDCPLSMPGSATNCVFSSAIVSTTHSDVLALAQRVAMFAGEVSPYQLLLPRPAFHPPKA